MDRLQSTSSSSAAAVASGTESGSFPSAVANQGRAKKLRRRCQAGVAHGIGYEDASGSIKFRLLRNEERTLLLSTGMNARVCPILHPHKTGVENVRSGQPEQQMEFLSIDDVHHWLCWSMAFQAALSGDNPSPTSVEPQNRAMLRGIGFLFVNGPGYADLAAAAAEAMTRGSHLGPLLRPIAEGLEVHSEPKADPGAGFRYATRSLMLKCYNNKGDRHTIAQRLWWVPLPRSVGRGALARGSQYLVHNAVSKIAASAVASREGPQSPAVQEPVEAASGAGAALVGPVAAAVSPSSSSSGSSSSSQPEVGAPSGGPLFPVASAASSGPLPFRAYCDTPTVLRCAGYPHALVEERSVIVEVLKSTEAGATGQENGSAGSTREGTAGSGGGAEVPDGFLAFPAVITASFQAGSESPQVKVRVSATVLLPQEAPTCTRGFVARSVLREVAMQSIRMHHAVTQAAAEPKEAYEATTARKQAAALLSEMESRGVPRIPTAAADVLLRSIADARREAGQSSTQRPRKPPQTYEESMFQARIPCGGHVEEDVLAVSIALCLAAASLEGEEGRLSAGPELGSKAREVHAAGLLSSCQVSVEMPPQFDASSEESRAVFVEPPPVDPQEASAAIAFPDAAEVDSKPQVSLIGAGDGVTDGAQASPYSAPEIPTAPPVVWNKAERSTADSSLDASARAGLKFGVGGLVISAPQLGALAGGIPSIPLGLDCEMVDTVEKKKDLARFTVVDAHGRTLADHHVKPAGRITNYEFRFSGITPEHMDAATADLVAVRRRMAEALDKSCSPDTPGSLLDVLVPQAVLAGHGLENDLVALRMTHDRVCDSALQFEHRRGLPSRSSLKYLCERQLGRRIRVAPPRPADGSEAPIVPHDSAEDAAAALELLLRRCAGGPAWGMYHTAWGHVPRYLHSTRAAKSRGSGGSTKARKSPEGGHGARAGGKRKRPAQELTEDELLGTCVAANEATLAAGIETMSPPSCTVAGSIGFCQQHATGGSKIVQVGASADGLTPRDDINRVLRCVSMGSEIAPESSLATVGEETRSAGSAASGYPSESPSLAIGEIRVGAAVESIIALDTALASLPKEGRGYRVLAVLCQGNTWEEDDGSGEDRGNSRKRSRTQGMSSMADAKRRFESMAPVGGAGGAAAGGGGRPGSKDGEKGRPVRRGAADASVTARWGSVTFLQV